MKTNLAKFLFLFLVLPLIRIQAQTENTDAFANIVTPITITETRSLHFGTLSTSSAVGTCVLAPSGTRTQTGGVALTSLSPTATSAAYTVTGTAGIAYNISLPTTNITVTRNGGGGQTMTISTFISSKTGNASILSGTGTDSFTVGATLNVGASQVAGLYQGNFNVTVTYN